MNTTTEYLALPCALGRAREVIYFIAHWAEQIREDLTRTVPVNSIAYAGKEDLPLMVFRSLVPA